MKTKTYCDLCDKHLDCIKMLDMLWVCIICRMKFYTDKEVELSTINNP